MPSATSQFLKENLVPILTIALSVFDLVYNVIQSKTKKEPSPPKQP